MKVSVAMTTYNGSKYVYEQLQSLLLQTRRVEEVIIVDDYSSDNTIGIVEEFLKVNKLKWKVYRNSENVGWRKNFRKAIYLCTGDIIFLCDQDDIWDKNKIKEMVDAMQSNSNIKVLVSNYSVIYESRDEKVHIKGLENGDGTIEPIRFDYKSFYPLRPGCTFAVKKEIIELMKKRDLIDIAHDCIIWNYGAIVDGLYLLNRQTSSFRRHIESASVPSEPLDLDRRIKEINESLCIESFLNNVVLSIGEGEKLYIIDQVLKFNSMRIKMLTQRSFVKLIAFTIGHFKMYPTKRNLCSDLFVYVKAKMVGRRLV